MSVRTVAPVLPTQFLGNLCSHPFPPFFQVRAAWLISLLRLREWHRHFLVHSILPPRWHKLGRWEDDTPVIVALLPLSPHFSDTSISPVPY
jgi:hypothetical protein